MDNRAAPVKDETDSKAAAVNGATANISKEQGNGATGNNKVIQDKGVTTDNNRATQDRDVTDNNRVGKVNRAHIKRIADTATVTDNHLYMANARISIGTVHNDKIITSAGTALSKATGSKGMELHPTRPGKGVMDSRATTSDATGSSRANGVTDSKATTRDATDSKATTRDATDNNKAITSGATGNNKAIINDATGNNKAITSDATDNNKAIISVEMGNRAIISDATDNNKAVSSVQMVKPELATISKEADKGADPKQGLTSAGKAARAVSLKKMIKGLEAVSLALVQNRHMAKKMIKNPTNPLKTTGNNNFKKPNKHG